MVYEDTKEIEKDGAMFGNSYTALVVQINAGEVGLQIWGRIKGYSFVNDLEVFCVRYFDLIIILLQGTKDFISSIKDTLLSMIQTNYDELFHSRSILVETCPNLAKNTYSPGRMVEEEVESVECLRMSFVFQGYADVLPFLSLINAPPPTTSYSPPQESPRPVPAPPREPPRPFPVPRPMASPPRSYYNPRPMPPRSLPPANPRPSYNQPRPPPPRPQAPPPRPIQDGPDYRRPPRMPYVPRPLPPRPSYGNPPPNYRR